MRIAQGLVGAFSFLSLLILSFLFAPLANVLSAFTHQLLPLPLRVSWERIGRISFPVFFFAFHQFSSQKRVCYYFIDDIRVRVCAEAGLKDSFFLHLIF